MVQLLNADNMDFDNVKEPDFNNVRLSLLSITLGTIVGLVTYWIFLYLNIAIFGWNFGLVFAPLAAGYFETWVNHRLMDGETGAISALILFIVTTIYSFIIANPTFGFNLLTFGISIIIFQAAIPTAVNYILIVVLLNGLTNFKGLFKKISDTLTHKLKINEEPHEKKIIHNNFDENKSNERLNELDFVFITSTDLPKGIYQNIGHFQATTVIKKNIQFITDDESAQETLYNIKEGKDECLIKLAKIIKENGGQGVVDLEISYGLVGLGGDSFQINAMGMGVKFDITSIDQEKFENQMK